MRRPRPVEKPLAGWLATHGSKGGGRILGVPPKPSCGSFKLPLPQSAEETMKIVSRNDCKSRDLTGWDVHALENEQNPQFLKLQAHAFFTPPRLREDGALCSQAALSPISVNALEGGALACRPMQTSPAAAVKHLVVRLAISKQVVGMPGDLITLKNLGENLQVSTSSIFPECNTSVHDTREECVKETRGSRSENMVNSVVLSNSSFLANNMCIGQSFSTDSSSSTYCTMLGPHSSNGTFQQISVTGTLRGLPRINESSSSLESSGPQVNDIAPGMLSGGNSLKTILVSPTVSSVGAVGAPRSPAMVSVSSPVVSSGSDIASSSPRAMFSRASVGGNNRIASYQMESTSSIWSNPMAPRSKELPESFERSMCERQTLIDVATAIQIYDTSSLRDVQEGEIHTQVAQPDTQVAARAVTKEWPAISTQTRPPFNNLMARSRWVRKGRRASDLDKKNGKNCKNARALALRSTGGSMQSGNCGANAQPKHRGSPESVERSEQEVLLQAVINETSVAKVEAELESDIQQDIEEEISKEILILSQKLANLQTHYRSKRMGQNGSKPAVLSCPQTPLLLQTPWVAQKEEGKGEFFKPSHTVGAETTVRTHKGRVVAAKFVQRKNNTLSVLREKRPEIKKGLATKEGSVTSLQLPRRSLGAATTFDSNANISHYNHTSKDPLLVNRRAAVASNAPHGFSGRGQELAESQAKVQLAEESLEATPSNGGWNSARSFRRDSVLNPKGEMVDDPFSLGNLIKHPSVCCLSQGACLRIYPDRNKGFDWVKTLRSGGMVLHSSPGPGNSSTVPSGMSSPVKDYDTRDTVSKKSSDDGEERDVWTREHPANVLKDSGAKSANNVVRKALKIGGNSPSVADLQENCSTLRTVASRYGNDFQGVVNRQKRCPEPGLENRPAKSGKKIIYPHKVGDIESKLAVHLLKAGLVREPSFRKPASQSTFPDNLRSKTRAVASHSTGKDSGKCLKKSLGGLNCKIGQLGKNRTPHDNKKSFESSGVGGGQQDDRDRCEVEYESFLEAPDTGEKLSDLSAAIEAHSRFSRSAAISEEEESKQSILSLSPHDIAQLSEAAVVSLKKNPQSTKKSFIRCIELVPDMQSTQTPNSVCKTLAGSTGTTEILPCHPIDGCVEERTHISRDGQVEKHFNDGCIESGFGYQGLNSRVHMKGIIEAAQHPCGELEVNRETAEERVGLEDIADIPANTVYRSFSEGAILKSTAANLKPSQSDVRVSGDLEVVSADKSFGSETRSPQPKEGGKMQGSDNQVIMTLDYLNSAVFEGVTSLPPSESEGPDTLLAWATQRSPPPPDTQLNFAISTISVVPASCTPEDGLNLEGGERLTDGLRAQWEELIDALEKERLELPKIRTAGSNDMGAVPITSARDSGCVKRIAGQVKAIEHFNREEADARLLDRGAFENGILANLSTFQRFMNPLITSCEA